MKKFNHAMALKWMIYLPLLLPACIVFGALEGMFNMTLKVFRRMSLDLDIQARGSKR